MNNWENDENENMGIHTKTNESSSINEESIIKIL